MKFNLLSIGLVSLIFGTLPVAPVSAEQYYPCDEGLEGVYIEDSKDCTKYYLCQNNSQGTEKICPKGEFFDIGKGECRDVKHHRLECISNCLVSPSVCVCMHRRLDVSFQVLVMRSYY